jgi:cytochrome P450
VSGSQSPAELDPFELPDTIQFGVDDPYPVLAEALRQGTVQRGFSLAPDSEFDTVGPSGPEDWVSVFGYDEVREVLRDGETFSSQILDEIMGPVVGRTLVALDEPDHSSHRALVAPAFRTKLLARWEHELVRRVVDELVDSFEADGQADLVRCLTFPFPVRVIARILGLPENDIPQFQRWSMELISAPVNWDRAIAASESLRGYFAEIVTARRHRSEDDLISELVDTELDGHRLDDEEIFGFLRLLLPAGIETTYRALGTTLFALLSNPDQLDDVRRHPDLRIPAIEEALRWESPFVLLARRAVRDTQVGGVDIAAGTNIDVFVGAANRDDRRFPEPDRFDVHRSPTPHVTFGFGPHVCLGMHLARMEMRVALDAVFERLPDLRFDPDVAAPRIVGSIMRSPDSLPVRFGSR